MSLVAHKPLKPMRSFKVPLEQWLLFRELAQKRELTTSRMLAKAVAHYLMCPHRDEV